MDVTSTIMMHGILTSVLQEILSFAGFEVVRLGNPHDNELWVASWSWGWPPVNSQQETEVQSPGAAGKWILPTTWAWRQLFPQLSLWWDCSPGQHLDSNSETQLTCAWTPDAYKLWNNTHVLLYTLIRIWWYIWDYLDLPAENLWSSPRVKKNWGPHKWMYLSCINCF